MGLIVLCMFFVACFHFSVSGAFSGLVFYYVFLLGRLAVVRGSKLYVARVCQCGMLYGFDVLVWSGRISVDSLQLVC